jgi:type I restriction enzyme S subunit
MPPYGGFFMAVDPLQKHIFRGALKEEDRRGGAYSVFGSNGVVGSHDECLVEAPGIIVGRKGNPGTVEWSETDFYPIDTTFYVKIKAPGIGMRFLFYALQYQRLSGLSADSAVPGLNRNHAYLNLQIKPPAAIVSAFEAQSKVVFRRRSLVFNENMALVAFRDTLLPKLISGELRIPEAEKLLEQAGV